MRHLFQNVFCAAMPSQWRVAVVGPALLSLECQAHHSFFGRFDTGASMELQGEVTRVTWRNPHAHIFLTVADDRGNREEWDPESGSPTLMRRAGIPADAIKNALHRLKMGSRMDYRMRVNDPVNFTEPVELSKLWLHIPDEQIIPFNCEEAGAP